MEDAEIGGMPQRESSGEYRRHDRGPDRLEDSGEEHHGAGEFLQRPQLGPRHRLSHQKARPQRKPRAQQVGEVRDEEHVA